MLGPVDYIIVGFEGNTFDGSILDELAKAVDSGIIRVIDLLFIMKDSDGNVVEGEFEDQSPDLQAALGDIGYDMQTGMPLLSDSDVAKIGEQMANDTSAGVIMLEHVWAKGLKQALIDAGGFLLADGRVHPEAIEMALEELQTQAA